MDDRIDRTEVIDVTALALRINARIDECETTLTEMGVQQ
jgi:hypothetical protein